MATMITVMDHVGHPPHLTISLSRFHILSGMSSNTFLIALRKQILGLFILH